MWGEDGAVVGEDDWRLATQIQMLEPPPPPMQVGAPEHIYEALDQKWSQVRHVQESARLRRERLSHTPPPVPPSHPRSGGGGHQYKMEPSHHTPAMPLSRGNPRQIQIERKDNGFGFTLRHFIVYPPEEGCDTGPPITEPMDTIFVKSVKEFGPAVRAGLNIGDRIVSVNGETVSGRSYAQVVQLIQKSRDTLFLVVVPREDDILQVYFSEIAQNPESNRRHEPPPVKPPWPGASVCSSSSRESSPFSSKSDSTRDSVYGQNRDYPRPHSRDPQHEAGEGVPRQFATQALYGNLSRPPELAPEHSQYDKLQVPGSLPPDIETDHCYSAPDSSLYAVPGVVGSSSSTLGSSGTTGTWPVPANSWDSMDSDNSRAAGFNSRPDESVINKIKKDCEKKDEFLKNQTYPTYLSSPPKEVDTSPYGIANLSSTMPPPTSGPVDEYKRPSPPTERAATPPQGYVRGNRGANWSYDNSYDDAFSRNNFVIVGSRTLHCEPPQVYQPTIPRHPVCVGCVSGDVAVPQCGGCHYHAPICHACAPPPCCGMMTMTTPYQPRPPRHDHPYQRPATLHGIQSLQSYGFRGNTSHSYLPIDQRLSHGPGSLPHHLHRHDPPRVYRPPPPVNTTVHMHPDPLRTRHDGDPVSSISQSDRETNVILRRKQFRHDDDERNLRRVSYLQATKEERMDVEENLTGDSGLAPIHSIKKLKSIFSEKANEQQQSHLQSHQPPSLPPPPSPRTRELKPTPDHSPHPVPEGVTEGYLTCKVAIVDGKKAIDRSWKTVYVVLRSNALYMYKDKKLATENPNQTEEKPVKLNETEVEVADDYTKRKNVFRVKTDGGSEYLFQAEDEGLMKHWVQAIDQAAMAIIVDERKDANKLRKLTSFRNRSPTGQSPSNKSRKSSTDTIQPPFKDKEKDKKNWKGKMVKQLKKMGGGGHGPMYPEGGSVGVPLDECPLCPASPDSDIPTIPYLIKVCCDIVNERGLEIVGIYRVPGNNAAVTYLTEQINKGVDHFALDDHRWQDVNVVSSLLKSFFRKLPDPLFTMDMYSLLIDASKLDQPVKRLDLLRKLIRDLPEINYETVKYLCAHLCNVVSYCSVNKMEIRNLAIVFGPTLVRTSDDNMVTMVTDMSQQCRIIESILSNYDYFFNDTDDVEVKEDEFQEDMITGSSRNQSLMLANLQKLEDAGKVQSPKNDMSTKDIATSIISAANRKMLRTITGSSKGKKESLSDCDRLDETRTSESRRDSESVIHGALQIASAVPGLINPLQPMGESNNTSSGRETPDIDFCRQFYGRQNSRGSISGDLVGLPGLGKRRGSLPVCSSKRGSICEYSGGAMCESTPVGEICETRLSIMQLQSEMEKQTNGDGVIYEDHELQEPQGVVTTGKLSLNVSSIVENTVSVATSALRPDPPDPPDTNPANNGPDKVTKFPIETYAGLDAATAERIKKFEAETKAMLTRPVAGAGVISRSTQRLSEEHYQETSSNPWGSTDLCSSRSPATLPFRMTGPRHAHGGLQASSSAVNLLASSSVNSLLASPTSGATSPSLHSSLRLTEGSSQSSLNQPQQPADPSRCRLTTPDPDPGPLDGGILLEDPYPSDDYYPAIPQTERRFLTYRTSLPNLPVPGAFSPSRQTKQSPVSSQSLSDFDTNKVVAHGTLMRLKQRGRPELFYDSGGGAVETIFDCGEEKEQETAGTEENSFNSSNTEKLLSNLTVSFDQKMRLLLDPNYQSNGSTSSSSSPTTSASHLQQNLVESSGSPSPSRQSVSGPLPDLLEMRPGNKDEHKMSAENKKEIDEARNIAQQAKQGSRKVELRRSNRVDKKNCEPVLRQVNNRVGVRRSDSLTKKEKTELNIKKREGGGEKENKVKKLREKFENSSGKEHEAGTRGSRIDVNKLRKKLSERNNRRIKRRHTVGGTKDFGVGGVTRRNSLPDPVQVTAALRLPLCSCSRLPNL